jgi:hypothetical protein
MKTQLDRIEEKLDEVLGHIRSEKNRKLYDGIGEIAAAALQFAAPAPRVIIPDADWVVYLEQVKERGKHRIVPYNESGDMRMW